LLCLLNFTLSGHYLVVECLVLLLDFCQLGLEGVDRLLAGLLLCYDLPVEVLNLV